LIYHCSRGFTLGDHRQNPRVRRRLRVAFNDGAREHTGFTINLSRTGFSLHSNFVLPGGRDIRGRIALPSGPEVEFVGQVRWVRKLRGTEVLYAQHAMGVMFQAAPAGAYAAFLRDSSARPPAALAKPAAQPAPTDGADSEPAPASAPTLQPGQEGRLEVTVRVDDLAAPGDVYECSVCVGRAALWMEQAAVRAVAGLLPPWAATVGLTMQLTITHAPPTPVGAKLVAMARLVALSDDGRELTFALALREGSHLIARGQHVRVVIEPRRKGS